MAFSKDSLHATNYSGNALMRNALMGNTQKSYILTREAKRPYYIPTTSCYDGCFPFTTVSGVGIIVIQF
jgi:hypothetical protein